VSWVHVPTGNATRVPPVPSIGPRAHLVRMRCHAEVGPVLRRASPGADGTPRARRLPGEPLASPASYQVNLGVHHVAGVRSQVHRRFDGQPTAGTGAGRVDAFPSSGSGVPQARGRVRIWAPHGLLRARPGQAFPAGPSGPQATAAPPSPAAGRGRNDTNVPSVLLPDRLMARPAPLPLTSSSRMCVSRVVTAWSRASRGHGCGTPSARGPAGSTPCSCPGPTPTG
jgi:hypothetical protein